MATPGPSISRELQEALRRAFNEAQHHRHEYVTLEHVLLGLLDDPGVVEALAACGADQKRLRGGLREFLDRSMERLPEDVDLQVQQTLGVRRVLQRAAIHVVSSDQDVIKGTAVLVQMWNEEESYAVYLLEREGLTQFDLKRFVSHGIVPEAQSGKDKESESQKEEEGEDEDGEPRRDPLEAYTTELVAEAAEGNIDPLIG